jgi:hypothetical protein
VQLPLHRTFREICPPFSTAKSCIMTDFPVTPYSRLGEWLLWLFGPSTTTVKEGVSKTSEYTIRTDEHNPWTHATIKCVRIIYHTQYRRWWMPSIRRNLYIVSSDVAPELIVKYGKEVFRTKAFPMLCNRLLKWTTYPHLIAIHTYLDELRNKVAEIRRLNAGAQYEQSQTQSEGPAGP